MIPLQTTIPVKKFPRATLWIVAVWVLADIVSRAWPGPREDFLLAIAFRQSRPFLTQAVSVLFHNHLLSLFVSLLFFWVFAPRVFERRGVAWTLAAGMGGFFLALFSFAAIHPENLAPLLTPESFLGALLGMYMRRDIWGTVNAFVVGPGWARVFEVPSYVVLFFWFFYLLLNNLFLSGTFADAPMLYWLPFLAFLWGFAVESILGLKHDYRIATVESRS